MPCMNFSGKYGSVLRGQVASRLGLVTRSGMSCLGKSFVERWCGRWALRPRGSPF